MESGVQRLPWPLLRPLILQIDLCLPHSSNCSRVETLLRQTVWRKRSGLSFHAKPSSTLGIRNGILRSAHAHPLDDLPLSSGPLPSLVLLPILENAISQSCLTGSSWVWSLGLWHGVTEYILCGYSGAPAASCFIKGKRYIWLQSLVLVKALW